METIETTKTTNKDLLKRIFGSYFRPYILEIVIATFFIIVAAAAGVIQAKLIQPAMDEAFTKTNMVDFIRLIWIALAIFGITFLRAVSSYTQNILLGNLGNKVIRNLQNDILHKLLSLDMPFFEKYGSSGQLSRFTNDVFLIRQAFTEMGPGTFSSFLMIVGLLILLFTLDWPLALASLIIIPIVGAGASIIGKTIRRYTKKQQEIMAQSLKDLDDSLKGIPQVLLFQSQKHEFEKNSKNFSQYYRNAKKTLIISGINRPFNQIILGILLTLFIIAGGYQLMHHQTTIGTFTAFLAGMYALSPAVRRIANDYINLQKGLAACQNIFWLLDHPNKVKDIPNAKPLRFSKGIISLNHVFFEYDDKRQYSIQDVSFKFKEKRKYAIVGPSGAGKSTLLKLMGRFYDPTQGTITIDDQNIKNITQHSLHKTVAFVAQDNWLYNTTIRHNVCYGLDHVSDKELDKSLHMAHLNEYISSLPKGLETLIGERGVHLSGGQRQRIAIARALLANSPILLLDEATSSLDANSEKKINAAIAELTEKTIIIVAHRLSSIMVSDETLLLKDGLLLDHGTHHNLYARNTLYKQLVDNQQF